MSALMLCLLTAYAPVEQLGKHELSLCGEDYAPPFGNSADARDRPCVASSARQYRARHAGLAYEVLNLESGACFVPDAAFRLLDEIVDESLARVAASTPREMEAPREKVLRVSTITGNVLEEKGFGLYIPTATIADALLNRAAPGEPSRHLFDCDVGSMILITVAEKLGMPAALVEITLPSGNGHNYVRWETGSKAWLDWDTNGRAPCKTPENLPSFEGRSMTREETMSYVTFLRAGVWKRRGEFGRAATDYKRAIEMAPDRPLAMNNFAWMVATKEFADRQRYRQDAVRAATRAVALHRLPNYLDTLGCAHAYAGDFQAAISAQTEAVRAEPGNREFSERLALFQAATPRDCTGAA